MSIFLHHKIVFDKLTKISQKNMKLVLYTHYTLVKFSKESFHKQFYKLSTKIFLVKCSSRTLCMFKAAGVFEFLGKYQEVKCKIYLSIIK